MAGAADWLRIFFQSNRPERVSKGNLSAVNAVVYGFDSHSKLFSIKLGGTNQGSWMNLVRPSNLVGNEPAAKQNLMKIPTGILFLLARQVGFATNDETSRRFCIRFSFCELILRSGLALCFSLVLCLGCGHTETLVPVAAQVTHGGKPLTTGTVSYRPDAAKGNKSLHHPTGTIDDQGNYKLHTSGSEGAPPGWYKVVVFANEKQDDAKKAHPGMPKSIIPGRYNEDKTTPLAVEVKTDAPARSYDLRLEK